MPRFQMRSASGSAQNPTTATLTEQIRGQMMHDGGAESGKLSLSLLHLHLADTLRGRLRYCRMQLRSNVGEWMLVPLPSQMWFLYSVIRSVRLMGRLLFSRAARVQR